MSQRMYDIIDELEIDYGVQLHANDIPDILCNGDGCRHAECQCWDDFREEVAGILRAQSKAEEAQHARSARMLKKSKLREAV